MKVISGQSFLESLLRSHFIDGVTVNDEVSTKYHQGTFFVQGKVTKSTLSKFHFSRTNFGNFTFENCKIKELILDEITFTTMLTISNCSIDKLSILRGFKAPSLTIAGNQIPSAIIEFSEIQKLAIQHNNIKEITISENNIGELKIEGNANSYLGKMAITGTTLSVAISDASLDDLTLAIRNNNRVTLTKCKIDNNLIIDKDVNSVLLKSCSVLCTKIITNASIDLKSGDFDSIKSIPHTLPYSITTQRDESGNDCHIRVLDVSNSSGYLTLHNTKISSLFANNFLAQGTTSFKFLAVKNELRVESSTIENVKFHNVNFSDAEIRLLNTSFAKSELINVEWPKGHQLYEYSKDISKKTLREKLNTLWPLKESYRQLKVLSLDQHNKIDAVAFQKHEIKVYWKIVNLKTWSPFQIKEFGNWLILCTNWLFSDFGQSIGRPLAWLLVVHSFLVYRLLATHPLGIELQLNPSLWDWQATNEGFGMFLNLLSPVHDAELQNDFMKKPESIYGTIDFFMRIASGYFLYYFIRATRKFNYSI